MMRKWARFLLKILSLALAVLIVVGAIYEQLGERRDKQKFSQIGRSVDIGGRSLNLSCSGEGSPVVMLEGAVGYAWAPIQREIEKSTRVCWYDRAGYGWSDEGPSPRTSAAMADDLHTLLKAAAVSPPFVLVGASFNGFPVRVFAGKYLDEVAGVVLVDASHEDQQEPASMKSPAARLPAPVRNMAYMLLPLAGRVGLVRLMIGGAMREPPEGMTQEEARYFYFLSNLPKSFVTAGDEARNWETSANQARTAKNLGARPLIVLTAGQPFVPDDPADAREAQAFHDTWTHELQPQLARLSTRGKQVIVQDSGHSIAPKAVIAAIQEVIADVRGEARK